MSANGLDVFDKTVQVTNTWLEEIMADHGPDRQLAWHMLGVVLRATRDRLPVELAAHLGAQLPLLVRGTYYEQYEPAKMPDKSRSLEDFVAKVQDGMAMTRPVNGTKAIQSAFRAIAHHIDPGQSRKVRDALPEDLRALWPDPDTVH